MKAGRDEPRKMRSSPGVGIAAAVLLAAACGRGGDHPASPPAVHSPDGSGTAQGSAGSSGTTMSKSTVTVAAKVTATKPGRPPLERLTVDLDIDNPGDAARWVTIAKNIPVDPDNDGGVDALEVRGSGAALLGNFRGSNGVYAVRVAGHAKVAIANLEIGWWKASVSETKPPDLVIQVADELTVGGAPAKEWFGADPLLPDGTRIDAAISGTDAHATGGDEAQVALTGAARQAASLTLP